MRLVFVVLLASLAFAPACSNTNSADRSIAATGTPSGGEARTEVTDEVTASGVEKTMEATVGVASAVEGTAGESSGSAGTPFVASPEASGGSSYEADTILAVRYGVHKRYERVVLDLGTGDEPAGTVPEWILSSPKGDGLLRVTLPSASATAVSDGRFGDDLLKSFYVVRGPEGGMFVDVFARRAFAYRVLELPNPARLVVDFKPTGAPLAVPLPAVGGKTVLVEPRARARIAAPLTVSGYSRNFEASNTVVLTKPGGEVMTRQTVMSNDWSSTWGYFEATLDLPPFGSKGTLSVGTESARAGTFEGVDIPVRGG